MLALILSVQEGQLAKYIVLQATSYKLLQSSFFLDEGCHSGHLGGTLPGPISPDSADVGKTGFHIHHLDDHELGANQEERSFCQSLQVRIAGLVHEGILCCCL